MTESKARDYSETLFLPKTDFPMRAGLPQKEPEILALWEKTGGRSGHWRRPPGELATPLLNTAANPVLDLDAQIEGLIGDSEGESPV